MQITLTFPDTQAADLAVLAVENGYPDTVTYAQAVAQSLFVQRLQESHAVLLRRAQSGERLTAGEQARLKTVLGLDQPVVSPPAPPPATPVDTTVTVYPEPRA